MATEHVDLTTIGLFSLVSLPYALKFLWAPLMDRFIPPGLSGSRRRGWMLATQLALAVSIALMGLTSPAGHASLVALLAVVVAFISASQDIAIDAYRTDVLEESERGPGASLSIFGYRVAMLFSGAVPLFLADYLAKTGYARPWMPVYFLMAAMMLVGALAAFFAPEPRVVAPPPKSLWDAVALPFMEFFRRGGAIEILAFAVLYKLDTVMATALLTKFILDLGFSLTDIAWAIKIVGFWATMGGVLVGGMLMVKLGMKRSLWTFGLIQGASGLSFTLLAHFGHSYPLMVISIALENFCSAMGTAAFAAFLMSLCDKRYTATQYALLTSLMAVSRSLGGAPTGYLAQALGWEHYYVLSTLIAIPGLLLLTRFDRWNREIPAPALAG